MVESTIHYSIEAIKEEARQLVYKGVVSRQQPIYTVCKYIPPREWMEIECELEKCDYLLRDRICDLVPSEEWND